MKKAILAMALVSSIGHFAHAGDPIFPEDMGRQLLTVGITMSPTWVTVSPFYTTEDLAKKHKLIIDAREDIAYFVASEGAVRTVKFNVAMSVVRDLSGDQQSQDMDLAQTILADIQ